MFVLIAIVLLAAYFISGGLLIRSYCYNYNGGVGINQLEVSISDALSLFPGSLLLIWVVTAVAGILMISSRASYVRYTSLGLFAGSLLATLYSFVHVKIYLDEFTYYYSGDPITIQYSIQVIIYAVILGVFYLGMFAVFFINLFNEKRR